MEVAAEHDHQANAAKQPAVNKLKMLPEFEQVCRRCPRRPAMADSDMMQPVMQPVRSVSFAVCSIIEIWWGSNGRACPS